MSRVSSYLRFIAVFLLVTLLTPLPNSTVALANDLGATDFDLAIDLAGLAQKSVSIGALNCSDGSRTFASTTDMMIGLAMDQRVQTQLNLTCRPALNIDSGVKSVSGTIAIPSKGITDGVFTAECAAKSNMGVIANVAVGAGVAGLISLNVTSASAPLAFSCSFKGSSAAKATEVFGTIEGYGDVTGMCASACVAIGMTARATVTSATGELKGQTGTGSYTYTDAFEIPELASVADRLAQMKGKKRERDQRVSCPEGAVDCTVYDTNPCSNGEDTCSAPSSYCPPGAVCNSAPFVCPPDATCTSEPPRNASDTSTRAVATASRPPSRMNVTLRSGSGDVVILRPMPINDGAVAALTPAQPVTLSGPPSAKCMLTFTARKSVKRAVTLSANGSAVVSYNTRQITALTRQLGLPAKSKTKPVITTSVSCTSDAGATPVRSRRIQLG